MAGHRELLSVVGADAVAANLGETYGRSAASDAPVSLDVDLMVSDRFLLGRHRLAGSFRVTTESTVTTVVATTGVYRWETDDDRGDASATPFLARAGMSATAFVADAEVDTVSFPLAGLERTAQALYGDEALRVRFETARALTPALGRRLRALLEYARTVRGLALESELIDASLYRLLAATTLEWFPLMGDPVARSHSARSQREGYRRGRTFIEDFASLPISVDDIATAAGLPARQLDAAFRAYSSIGLGVTQELRRVRLHLAHCDLVAADPTFGDTVRKISLRWGFSPGHFARTYRKSYGVAPKWQLDR